MFQVVETKACGRLGHLKYVFHAVGPIVSTDVEQSIYELSETFFNCLELAEKLHLRSLAFPFISTGRKTQHIYSAVYLSG